MVAKTAATGTVPAIAVPQAAMPILEPTCAPMIPGMPTKFLLSLEVIRSLSVRRHRARNDVVEVLGRNPVRNTITGST